MVDITSGLHALLKSACKNQRFCRGKTVLTLTDAVEFFPDLSQPLAPYQAEVAVYRDTDQFPITPKEPAAIAEQFQLSVGSFLRLPKQYRRFFGLVGLNEWRSFKGFDTLLGLRVINGEIDIRRGVDSPWGMKWLSGQLYTTILLWAIHAEHYRRFGSLAIMPLPIAVVDIRHVLLDGTETPIEAIPLQGNRSYPWQPDNISTCRHYRKQLINSWLELLPNTLLADILRQVVRPEQEWLGGVIYDMPPHLRLEMPRLFTSALQWQQDNYSRSLERQITTTEQLAQQTEEFCNDVLRGDSASQSQQRAINLGRFLGICRTLKINILSFGVELANIAIDGSLPDVDTLQYRGDTIEWSDLITDLPPQIDFRFIALRDNLITFEAMKGDRGHTRVDNNCISSWLTEGLLSACSTANSVAVATEDEQSWTPTEVMHQLDQKLTTANTIHFPNIPRYTLASNMPRPEGLTFLKLIGLGEDAPQIWFTLIAVNNHLLLEIHHLRSDKTYERIPGDYFPRNLTELPRDFFNYIEEHMRMLLRKGVSQIILYTDSIVSPVVTSGPHSLAATS